MEFGVGSGLDEVQVVDPGGGRGRFDLERSGIDLDGDEDLSDHIYSAVHPTRYTRGQEPLSRMRQVAKDSTRQPSRAGALIELARIRASLSQVELARRARTSQTAISAYESGAKVPSLETLERILGAAGFDLRMSLALAEDHDESLARYLATVPAGARAKFEREQQARVAKSGKPAASRRRAVRKSA
ncbi:MAG: helix-turn-helix domain-containing protein [Acidimicrobiales bacterium]